MYEVLISHLRDLAKYDQYENTFTEAADAIEELIPFKEQVEKGMGLLDKADELLKAIKPRWIPVTEKLPDKDIPVFVYLFGDSPYIAWINHEGEWETEEFTIDRDYLPKAWMPLPERPKEG